MIKVPALLVWEEPINLTFISLFLANVAILHLQKTQENAWFSGVFRRYKLAKWAKNRLMQPYSRSSINKALVLFLTLSLDNKVTFWSKQSWPGKLISHWAWFYKFQYYITEIWYYYNVLWIHISLVNLSLLFSNSYLLNVKVAAIPMSTT